MAVAVKNTPDVGPSPLDRLPVASLIGVVYVLGSLGIIFGLLPILWWNVLGFSRTSFAAGSLLGVAMLAVAIGLGLLVVRGPGIKVPHGTRAGVAVGLLGLLIIVLLARWISLWVEHWSFDTGALSPGTGIVVVSVAGLGLLVLGLWLFFQPRTEKLLIQIEDQGWFHATSYKPMQGQRVRRGTILGVLLLAGAGIYTLISHQVLRRGSENWELIVPFTGQVTVTSAGDAAGVDLNPGAEPQVLDRYDFQRLSERYNPSTHVTITVPGSESTKFKAGQVVLKSEYETERKKAEADGRTPDVARPTDPPAGITEFRALTLLPSVQFTVPLLILAASIWFAWRIVNLPVFADFLIATEAEINKVSWTTRKRLVQDTIVVLVTVVLMAGFLFGTDIVWKVLLGSKVINVLQINDQQQEKTDGDRPLW
jgi:preprotein translocase SecE subunit